MERTVYRSGDMSITNVGAFPGSDAFLIITDEKTALIDSGFSFAASIMLENIRSILRERELNFCLLTHSHYDHASGSAYLKDVYPELKIVSGEYGAGILKKPTAVKVMREMNAAVAPEYGITEFEDKLSKLGADIIVHEGDVISLGKRTLRCIESPGHTRCSVSFYMPEEDLLISSETQGVYGGNELVSPCCLVGYQMTMDYIERMRAMHPKNLLIPHYKVLSGDESLGYIDNARRCNELMKELVCSEHKKGSSYEEIFAKYFEALCSPELLKIQPMKALKLNASYMIPMIIKECC